MRKIPLLVFAAFLQIVLCVSASDSADKKKSSVQKEPIPAPKEEQVRPVTTPVPAYLNTSFDTAVDKIATPFLGHDIEKVYEAFDKRKKVERKDEFETSEQYQKRLSDLAGRPLFGSVGMDAIFAFVVVPASQYNADEQTLTISVPTSSVWQSAQIDKSRSAVEVKTGEISKKKSVGQNAYGAKVDIEEIYVKTFELAIHNTFNFEMEKVLDESVRRMMERTDTPKMPESFLESMKKTAFVSRLKMGPAEARDAKNKVAALILAKSVPPHISYGAILRKATFKDPTEFFALKYYVDVDVTEIWFYDKTTGAVIARIKGR